MMTALLQLYLSLKHETEYFNNVLTNDTNRSKLTAFTGIANTGIGICHVFWWTDTVDIAGQVGDTYTLKHSLISKIRPVFVE